MAAKITFTLLLILLIELPVVAYFVRKKKRPAAVLVALLANLVTWIVSTMLWQKNPDINLLVVAAGSAIFEMLIYWFFLGRNWKKAILMALISNFLSFLATQYIHLPDNMFQKQNNMVR